MISGSWTSGAASAQIIPASRYRDILTIQLHTAKGTVCFGFGTDAVIDASVLIVSPGDSITVRGHIARQAVYALGALGGGAYQEGDLSLNMGDAPL